MVQNGKDLVEDVHLKYRHHIELVAGHLELGTHYSERPAFALSKTPVRLEPTPCIGEDNQYVFTTVLGMSDDQFIRLIADGVVS